MAKLVIVGDGEERERLAELVASLNLQQRVVFTGRVSHNLIPIYLKAADVFVLNSSYEGLSHVMLEALAVGAPIIATNVGGNSEVIEHGKNGFLVRYGDLEQLAKAIDNLLQSKTLRHEFALRGKEKSKAFSWDRLVKETTNVFEEAAMNIKH